MYPHRLAWLHYGGIPQDMRCIAQIRPAENPYTVAVAAARLVEGARPPGEPTSRDAGSPRARPNQARSGVRPPSVRSAGFRGGQQPLKKPQERHKSWGNCWVARFWPKILPSAARAVPSIKKTFLQQARSLSLRFLHIHSCLSVVQRPTST